MSFNKFKTSFTLLLINNPVQSTFANVIEYTLFLNTLEYKNKAFSLAREVGYIVQFHSSLKMIRLGRFFPDIPVPSTVNH